MRGRTKPGLVPGFLISGSKFAPEQMTQRNVLFSHVSDQKTLARIHIS